MVVFIYIYMYICTCIHNPTSDKPQVKADICGNATVILLYKLTKSSFNFCVNVLSGGSGSLELEFQIFHDVDDVDDYGGGFFTRRHHLFGGFIFIFIFVKGFNTVLCGETGPLQPHCSGLRWRKILE